MDQRTADVPKEAKAAAVDVVAVAGELADWHLVPLGRPASAVVIGESKHVMPQRVDARKDASVLASHLADVVGVVVVKGIDPPARHLEQHGIARLWAILRFEWHRLAPGTALVCAPQRDDRLARISLLAGARRHHTQPPAVVGLHHIRLVGVASTGDLQAARDQPRVEGDGRGRIRKGQGETGRGRSLEESIHERSASAGKGWWGATNDARALVRTLQRGSGRHRRG